MRRDRNARAVRNVHGEFRFLERESRMRATARAPAIVCIEFYPISSMAYLIAHGARQFISAARFFRALRHIPFGRKSFRAVTAGGDDRAGGDKQTRAGNDSLIHCLL